MKRKTAVSMMLIALLACTKASESTDAKRSPKPPPGPASSEPSSTLSIATEIDGAPAAAIDSARLNATNPDFKNDEHRAWKLTSLLPNTNRPGVALPESKT